MKFSPILQDTLLGLITTAIILYPYKPSESLFDDYREAKCDITSIKESDENYCLIKGIKEKVFASMGKIIFPNFNP